MIAHSSVEMHHFLEDSYVDSRDGGEGEAERSSACLFYPSPTALTGSPQRRPPLKYLSCLTVVLAVKRRGPEETRPTVLAGSETSGAACRGTCEGFP